MRQKSVFRYFQFRTSYQHLAITKKNLLLIGFFLFFLTRYHAQLLNYPVRNYTSKDFGKKRNVQNQCLIQDKQGLMYFGTGNGISQYDGREWRFIMVKDGAYVSSMAVDSSGKIFIGSFNQFGFLEANNIGDLVYRSLSDSLMNDDATFGQILRTYATGKDIFFQSQEKIFVYNNKTGLKVLLPKTSFHTSFLVNGQFYARERQTGIVKFNGTAFQKIEGSEIFSNDGIFAMLPYDSIGKILVVTQELGLFIYDPKASPNPFSILKTSDEKLLIESLIYGGIKLSDGNFALNTLKAGLVIIDPKGNILVNINKQMGLRDDDVKQVYEDSQQNLWLALNNGISKIIYNSPLTYYSDESGLAGSVNAMTRNNDIFYAATSAGLFYVKENQNSLQNFKRVQNISNQVWDLVIQNNSVIAASWAGIFTVNENSAFQVNNISCRAITFDPQNNIWLAGNETGVTILTENFKTIKSIEGITTEIINLQIKRSSLKKGITEIWAGTLTQGTFRISINKDLECTADYLGFPEGLANECIYTFAMDDELIFGSSKGLYTFDNAAEVFKKSDLFSTSGLVSALSQQNEKIWVVMDNRPIVCNSKTNVVSETPFLSIDKGHLNKFFPENNICWIGSDDGLIRYDSRIKKDYSKTFPLSIRKVTASNDSLLFNGNWRRDRSDEKRSYDLPYALNSVSFEYSGIYFEDASKNLYSYKLAGQDTGWSKWTADTKTAFSNLHEGTYDFLVRSKNIYGGESNIASFSFKILTPWYRAWWAYMVYGIVFIISVVSFARLRTKQLEKEKVKLEEIIEERTVEIVKQKDEITHQKHLVDEQHKEITDSINYAQRIQRSLLASENILKDNLPEHFVLFKPKDVVSGDFYWASVLRNNNFALVTADSTGHGVPGAIMSMLNISCLNEAVEAHKLTEPNEILNATRKRIIQHLSNDGSAEGGKDGMDCSLISFDFSPSGGKGEAKMTYAAANNPVWIVRTKTSNKFVVTSSAVEKDVHSATRPNEEGEVELIELLPDKMPVGKHDHDSRSFTQHQFDLQKGDIVYAFTDGMPDQFGGPRGKKFMYKQLSDLLLTVSSKPLAEQKEIILQRFNDWKGTLEQVDDVCLIGIRI